MQVVQTADDPPYQGRMYFETIGWIRKSRKELEKTVMPKIRPSDRLLITQPYQFEKYT
jgi:hypothetical protein